MNLQVTFKMSDADLHKCIAQLGQKANAQQVVEEIFTKPFVIDFDRIVDPESKFFLQVGSVANLSMLHLEMEEADQRAASLAETIMKK